MKDTPQLRLKDQIHCLRDCAQELFDLAPDLPPDTETITLIARNLRITADNAANLVALHAAHEQLEGNGNSQLLRSQSSHSPSK